MISGGIGDARIRLEDEALLTGNGRFIDDIALEGQLHAAFLRAEHARARINSIDVAQALACPGVVAVYTGDDVCGGGLGTLHQSCSVKARDGSEALIPAWPAIATDQTLYVGDTVAMVIAEHASQARQALEVIEVVCEPLEHVTRPEFAITEQSPRLWPQFDTNVALDWALGDPRFVEGIFASAAHVTGVHIVQNRIVVAALETRGAIAEFDATTGCFTLYTPTQGGTPVQRSLANALGVSMDEIRVISPDVGGAFGIKAGIYPEHVLVAWAARAIGRPVKWYADRSDSFLADYHARDHLMWGEIALDEEGHFLAIRCECISNMGAYLTGPAPIIPTAGGTRLLSNVYRTPHLYAHTRCVFTNTVPVAAYRGAGKPEFCHLVERLVDKAASELKIDPIELRRRNLIGRDEMPFDTPSGLRYDSGDFETVMDTALALSRPDDFEHRRLAARDTGHLLGLGLCVYTEPDGFKDNRVTMTFDTQGELTVTTTAHNNGQGYRTVFGQVARTLLGLTDEHVCIVEGDTDKVGAGSGAGGSRVTTVTGSAMHVCANSVIEQAKALAAQLLQCDADELSFNVEKAGLVHAGGELTLCELGVASHTTDVLPSGVMRGLRAECHYDAPAYSYPCGAHICEVDIDQETGETQVTRYLHVSDFGTIVNPMLLEAQLHGGIAQGIGQVLYEDAIYDTESGQLVTGSFMDYCLPRATHVPMIEWQTQPTVCLTNPLGVKGCGESGTTASLPAVMNAIVDALREYDTSQLQMPAVAERVWRVLRQSGR